MVKRLFGIEFELEDTGSKGATETKPAKQPKAPPTPNQKKKSQSKALRVIAVLFFVGLLYFLFTYLSPDTGREQVQWERSTVEGFGSVLYIVGVLSFSAIWIITIIDMIRKKSSGLWFVLNLLSLVMPPLVIIVIISWWVYGRRN